MGKGEGNTVLILTDKESALIREALTPKHTNPVSTEAISTFNRGIARGTAKIAEEFAAAQKARKKP